jgi:hypothetical protein
VADGVAITAGSGTTIATDDAGAAGHVQIVKLAISADGSAALIPGDAANGVDVDVTRLPALPTGANVIGGVTQSGTWTVQPGNTQNTTPWFVQQRIDNALQTVCLSWDEMAGTAAVESALTNATSRVENYVALAAGSSYTVPASKRFRITNVYTYLKNNSTVNNLARFRIRAVASGSVANTSPIVFNRIYAAEVAAAPVAAAITTARHSDPIPEGVLDFAAGAQITFTWFTSAASCTVGMTIIGYLYTP